MKKSYFQEATKNIMSNILFLKYSKTLYDKKGILVDVKMGDVINDKEQCKPILC